MTEMSVLSRRSMLKAGLTAGGGIAAATLAACVGPAGGGWVYRSPGSSGSSAVGSATATPSAAGASLAAASSASTDPTAKAVGAAGSHDDAAEAAVRRFPEATAKHGNQPLAAKAEGDWKVFELDCSSFTWQIDAQKTPVNAVGYNGTWPGPLLRVTEGDRVRAIVKNALDETTGVHFHGQEVPNAMDGVPFITQKPIQPGGTFVYEFVARPAGSHMYHSHHNATDQVGRGQLGAFIVEPGNPALRYDRRYGTSQDIVWISNDQLGGFTINGKGFPATVPINAKLDERIAIRFMNEGVMMHPWHLHGMPMRLVARDGYPLGAAAFTCDTLGVNPGERWDVIVECRNPGVWAFHCHILAHAEGAEGMFGMVNALIVR